MPWGCGRGVLLYRAGSQGGMERGAWGLLRPAVNWRGSEAWRLEHQQRHRDDGLAI